MPNPKISGIILAGGRATRMGGVDKGLVSIQQRPMVEHIAAQLKPQCDELCINANRNVKTYEQYGRVFSDELADYQGPLAGILSAMHYVQHDWLITVPCDGPFLAANYVPRMYKQALQNQHKIAVATDASRIQPVYTLLHVSLADDLDTYLRSGERKIDKWFARHAYSSVSFADQSEMFLNINTEETLRQIEGDFSDIFKKLNY